MQIWENNQHHDGVMRILQRNWNYLEAYKVSVNRALTPETHLKGAVTN